MSVDEFLLDQYIHQTDEEREWEERIAIEAGWLVQYPDYEYAEEGDDDETEDSNDRSNDDEWRNTEK